MPQETVQNSVTGAGGMPARDTVLRWVMAGPLALIAAVVTMASMPLWLPGGAAGIDNLIWPILLFPALWAVYFLYALIEARPLRGTGVITAIILANAALIYSRF
ncbi:MAG: hypothetical protein KYX66_15975 [Blastomonas fulva]|nr:hypothetical protein [Blastomonas fulva]MDK2758223.1 hypothetical protein [Blastomonas fulva]